LNSGGPSHEKAARGGGGPLALSDGLRGSRSSGDGHRQDFEGDDLIAVIDLGKEKKIGRVAAGFLQNSSSWIILPSSVELAGNKAWLFADEIFVE